MISWTAIYLLPWILFHAFYISVIEIEHSAESKTAEIKIKVFSDDMADALRNAYGIKGHYQESDFFSENETKVFSYLSEHVNVTINGAVMKLELEKIEVENDTHWFYLTMKCPVNWEQVHIKADMLMEVFPTQSNMIKLNDQGDKQFFRLMKGHSSIEIE